MMSHSSTGPKPMVSRKSQGRFRQTPGAVHHLLQNPAGFSLGFQKLLVGFGGSGLQGLDRLETLLKGGKGVAVENRIFLFFRIHGFLFHAHGFFHAIFFLTIGYVMILLKPVPIQYLHRLICLLGFKISPQNRYRHARLC